MEIQPLDIVTAAILAAATLRGLFIGLVREGFSLASLGAAYVVVQRFTPPTADWVIRASNGDIGSGIAPWVAGAGLAIGTIAIVILIGRVLRRTLHSAGLSWADRFAGGFLGAAEGILVTGILMVLGMQVLGRDNAVFAETASLAALEEFERLAAESEIKIDVAAPPRGF